MPMKLSAARLMSAGAIFCSAAAGPVMAQSQIISLNEMKTATEGIRPFRPKDQFEAMPTGPDWAGRRFSYTVEPETWVSGGRQTCSGFPEWSFYNGSLRIAAQPEYIIAHNLVGPNGAIFPGQGEFYAYSLECLRDDESQYMASNAFGAQFNVTRWTERVVAIADSDPGDTKLRVYWNKALSGDEARALTRNLRVRASGTLDAWSGKRTIVCGTTTRTPTIDLPIEKKLDICLVKGRIDTLEFIDGSSGAVLYAATRKAR